MNMNDQILSTSGGRLEEKLAELKAPPRKFRIIGIDKFEPIPDGQFPVGDYDTLEAALREARKKTKAAMKYTSDSSIATVYYVYDDKGRYKGGDVWAGE